MLLVFAPSSSSDHPHGDGGGGGAVGWGWGRGVHAWACYLLHQHVETDRKMAVLVLQARFVFVFLKVRAVNTLTHSLTTVSRACPKPSGHQECENVSKVEEGGQLTLTFIKKKSPAAPLNARPSHPGNICVLQELRGCLVFLCCGRYQGGQ